MTPATILALAILSGGAYCASPDGVVIDYGDIRAVVTEMDGFVVIAVRGTIPDSLQNWIRNIDALPSFEHPQLGVCHSGFMGAADGLMPLLAPHIAGRNVMVTGHSLGGAIAIDLAALLKIAGNPPVAVVAFEPPRVGMEKMALFLATVDGVIYRFGDDPVPEVPMWPYRHPWQPIVAIGHSLPDPISCHDISGVIAWLQTQAANAPVAAVLTLNRS